MIDRVDDLLVKRPFTRIVPESVDVAAFTDGSPGAVEERRSFYELLHQADFLREYYPWGHKINSTVYYPDKVKYDEENGRYFTEKVFRASFPFQRIITVQHLVHLCGNDIRHELTSPRTTNEEQNLFLELQQGWLDKNIEESFYMLVKSVKITGDGALVFYLDGGKAECRPLSYLFGDTLFPHYDTRGHMDYFVRRYKDYDEAGEAVVTWLEVWDKRNLYTYRRAENTPAGSDYQLVSTAAHGFAEVPIVYQRAQGPCWAFSQDSIEKYELAVSHLCQNNMAYAFPIMILKGDSVEIKGDMYGAVKAITMGKDEDASLMNRPEGNESFKLQLTTLLDMIFLGSFTVRPPEVRSGDLPGVSIKLIYSPSLEQAIVDAKEFDRAVDKMVRLFKFAYGVEIGKVTRLAALKTYSWIEPYIHQNTAELINNLCMAANSEILSRETASEQTTYGRNDEFFRLIKQHRNAEQSDLLSDLDPRNTTSDTANPQEQ